MRSKYFEINVKLRNYMIRYKTFIYLIVILKNLPTHTREGGRKMSPALVTFQKCFKDSDVLSRRLIRM